MEDFTPNGFTIRSVSAIEANVASLALQFRKKLKDPTISIEQKEKLSIAIRQIYGSEKSIEERENKLKALLHKFNRWRNRKGLE